MLNNLTIQSHKGPYEVNFCQGPISSVTSLFSGEVHFLIDSNVAKIYKVELDEILNNNNTIVIKATEANKSIERIIPIIEQLVENKIRRSHRLVAIGGGIIQDITCFIASSILRGVQWSLIPTTLLSQADSCIGSKSSVNLGLVKNILGTFNPPREIYIYPDFLKTLQNKEIQSGVGEIVKVHVIDGVDSFNKLSKSFEMLFENPTVLLKYIQSALIIKKRYIEEDEFDVGVRNIFNYGHSFGHAIESTTNYKIPHGIAVTIGMDLANYISMKREFISKTNYQRMQTILRKNYIDYLNTPISLEGMLAALKKDKKNTSSRLVLILPFGEKVEIKKVEVLADNNFISQCESFFQELRNDEIRH
jgi:3-dehydroquinate synthase